MALLRKADYIYAIPDERAPEFTGENLVPSFDGKFKYETICHLVEQIREIFMLLRVASGDDYSSVSTHVGWPLPLVGKLLGRCKSLWDDPDTVTGTRGRSPKIGGGFFTWDIISRSAPTVIAGVKTEADLKALFPSSQGFPAQTYDNDTHVASLQPYETANRNGLYDTEALTSPDIGNDMLFFAVALAYSIEGTGLRSQSSGRRDPSFIWQSGVPPWLPVMFNASPYMLWFSRNLPFGDEMPGDFIGGYELLWSQSRAFYINPLASISYTEFNVYGSRATFQPDSISEDSAHPLEVLGTSRADTSSVASSFRAALSFLYPKRNAPSVSDGVQDKIGNAREIASVTEHYCPYLGAMSLSIPTPGGNLAGRVFGDSRITPDAIIYANNLLAKCTRILTFKASLDLPIAKEIDIDGNESTSSSGSKLLLINSSAHFEKTLSYKGTPSEVTLPNGWTWDDQGQTYVQAYITKQQGDLGDCAWEMESYSGGSRDLTIREGRATIQLGSLPSLRDGLGDGVFGSTCKVPLTLTASVDSYCSYHKDGASRVYETISVQGPDGSDYSQYISKWYNAFDEFLGVTTTDMSRMKKASATFVIWLDGRVECDPSTGRLSVQLDLPSPNALISKANDLCGFPISLSLYSVTKEYLLTRGDVRQIIEDVEAGSNSQLQDEVDAVMEELRSPFTYGDAPVTVGIRGQASVETRFNLAIEVSAVGPMILETHPRSGTLANP